MRQPRARSAASRSFVALTLIAFAVGCETVRPIGPGDTLRANEGLLVLHVRTEAPLRSISIGGEPVPFEVGRGTHLRLIAVSAGGFYRWSGLGVPENLDDPRGSRTVQFLIRDDTEVRFSVEPGRINYAGMLEVHVAYGISYRLVDRAAYAIEELRAQFPTWLAQYPMVYTGPARDVFLDRYNAANRAPNRAGASVEDELQ
jgi:hypothetical protein